MVNFCDFKNYLFYFVVAICDVVHDVKAIHGLCLLLLTPGYLF